MRHRPSLLLSKAAMTLVELLVVLAILATLAVFTATALTNAKRGADLKTSAALAIDALALARQSAVSLNAPVEIRIYSYEGKSFLKLFRVAQDGTVAEPIDRIIRLPESVGFSTNSNWSMLLTDAISGAESTDALGTFRKFRIKPNGTTDLEGTSPPTLTLIYQTDADKTSLPPNFFTLQIDLQTGAVTTFRPL